MSDKDEHWLSDLRPDTLRTPEALMALKQLLNSRLPVHEAFATYKRLAAPPDGDHIRLKPLRSLRDTAEQRSLTFVETAPAGQRFTVPSPHVIGPGDHRPVEAVTRSIFLACLSDACVRGKSNLIDLDDVALLDFQGSELIRIHDQLDFDPAIFQITADGAWIVTPPANACSIAVQEAFTLLAADSHNFGDWMWAYLPKYLAAALSGALPAVPILIDDNVPATIIQALELALPHGVEIIRVPAGATVRVGRLWCAASQQYMTLYENSDTSRAVFTEAVAAVPPGRFAPLIAELVRRLENTLTYPTRAERLFLARRGHLHRKLVNHAAIEAIAAARGFTIAYPEELDFPAQAGLLRQARSVIAPDGSAIYLALFARPGTKLCILSNPHTLRPQIMETGLLSAIGLDVTVMSGPFVSSAAADELDDYTIDPDVFSRFLDGLPT